MLNNVELDGYTLIGPGQTMEPEMRVDCEYNNCTSLKSPGATIISPIAMSLTGVIGTVPKSNASTWFNEMCNLNRQRHSHRNDPSDETGTQSNSLLRAGGRISVGWPDRHYHHYHSGHFELQSWILLRRGKSISELFRLAKHLPIWWHSIAEWTPE